MFNTPEKEHISLGQVGYDILSSDIGKVIHEDQYNLGDGISYRAYPGLGFAIEIGKSVATDFIVNTSYGPNDKKVFMDVESSIYTYENLYNAKVLCSVAGVSIADDMFVGAVYVHGKNIGTTERTGSGFVHILPNGSIEILPIEQISSQKIYNGFQTKRCIQDGVPQTMEAKNKKYYRYLLQFRDSSFQIMQSTRLSTMQENISYIKQIHNIYNSAVQHMLYIDSGGSGEMYVCDTHGNRVHDLSRGKHMYCNMLVFSKKK